MNEYQAQREADSLRRIALAKLDAEIARNSLRAHSEADRWRAAIILGAFLATTCVWWVVSSRMESRAFNRLTGAQSTTWDAMFVELRVQESPR